MRIILILSAAALMSACTQKEAATSSPSTNQAGAEAPLQDAAAPNVPAGFPKMTASYAATYKSSSDSDGPRDVSIEVDGAKRMRFSFLHPSGAAAAGVFDDAKDRYLMFREGPDAPKVAVVMPFEANMFDMIQSWRDESEDQPKRIGADSIAGLSCDVWEVAAAAEGAAARQACITRDGILMRAGDAGAEPEIVASSVDKGRIDPARFTVPSDFEIIDMGPCQAIMQGAMAGLQSGQQPDVAKMQECQTISMKAATVLGGFDE
jgi:hypothetical protein